MRGKGRPPDGRKDYDWAHLAARYFPSRVDDSPLEIEAKEQQRRERNRTKAEKAADEETGNNADAGERNEDDDDPGQRHLELD